MKKLTKFSTRSKSFVDTSGFYALLVKGDRMHERAGKLLARAAQTSGRFITTDYVLDETATLLRARGLGHLAEAFFDTVFSSMACQIQWMNAESFEQTRRFFLKHQDQAWSFTDCFSFLMMRGGTLVDALTTDVHFRHAGFNPLLV
jgi:predicted nucleic acid-binding protein